VGDVLAQGGILLHGGDVYKLGGQFFFICIYLGAVFAEGGK